MHISEDCWEVSGLLGALWWERVHGAAAVTKMGRINESSIVSGNITKVIDFVV